MRGKDGQDNLTSGDAFLVIGIKGKSIHLVDEVGRSGSYFRILYNSLTGGKENRNDNPRKIYIRNCGGVDLKSPYDKIRGLKARKWDLRADGNKMVLGRDLRLEHVVNMSLITLVGKFSYNDMNCFEIDVWVEEVWKP